jgi:hypothetical protein
MIPVRRGEQTHREEVEENIEALMAQFSVDEEAGGPRILSPTVMSSNREPPVVHASSSKRANRNKKAADSTRRAVKQVLLRGGGELPMKELKVRLRKLRPSANIDPFFCRLRKTKERSAEIYFFNGRVCLRFQPSRAGPIPPRILAIHASALAIVDRAAGRARSSDVVNELSERYPNRMVVQEYYKEAVYADGRLSRRLRRVREKHTLYLCRSTLSN